MLTFLTVNFFYRKRLIRFIDDCMYLLQDHVGEIIKKWESIDDEIWAKAIVMERNRRVAKVR